jgi:hypothetical protein
MRGSLSEGLEDIVVFSNKKRLIQALWSEPEKGARMALAG